MATKGAIEGGSRGLVGSLVGIVGGEWHSRWRGFECSMIGPSSRCDKRD